MAKNNNSKNQTNAVCPNIDFFFLFQLFFSFFFNKKDHKNHFCGESPEKKENKEKMKTTFHYVPAAVGEIETFSVRGPDRANVEKVVKVYTNLNPHTILGQPKYTELPNGTWVGVVQLSAKLIHPKGFVNWNHTLERITYEIAKRMPKIWA